MSAQRGDTLWAVIPVKELHLAKQRLAAMLTPPQRQALAAAMLEDVLTAVSGASGLDGLLVVTVDPLAASIARRYGARISEDGAYDGHTGAVTAAARLLTAEGCRGMMALPGDIPLITAAEIDAILPLHRAAPAPAFTIVPAHDERGSNAVLCSPPGCVPLCFGDDSYFPHLAVARDHGIEPLILRHPGIGMDIDHPQDIAAFLRQSAGRPTHSLALLTELGLASQLETA